jgi:crotonobetainyl-CoA:carnitine CoA-transferase CaiB-like acyl-CoA transferase
VARHFADVCRAIGRPELAEDPRFLTPRDLRHNSAEFIAILDQAFATRTLQDWAERFEAEGVWWEPVASPAEVLEDPQLLETDAFVDVPVAGGSLRVAGGPVSFRPGPGTPGAGGPGLEVQGPEVPGLGAHTDEVFSDLKLSSP